jgi:hypothetical protein
MSMKEERSGHERHATGQRRTALTEQGVERSAVALPATGILLGVDRGSTCWQRRAGRTRPPRPASRPHRRVVSGHARALDAASVKDAMDRCLNRRAPRRMAAVQRLARAK